jgi:hypothetical protein
MKVQRAAGAAILALIVSSGAFAQEDVPQKIEYRKWDIGTSAGLLFANSRAYGRPGTNGNDPSWTLNLDAGRFLTTHMKVDTGVMWSGSQSFYKTSFATAPSYEMTGYTLSRVQPTTVSGAITYQFLENAFVHPYVSAGMRLTFLREERETYSYPTNCCRPALVTTVNQTSLQARPFGAFGFKSYFNERWFVRSEVLLGFDAKGLSHGTARLGFGIDF